MKKIQKNNEPTSLTEHRASQYASYENINKKAKEDTRNALLIEQGYICCYCMKRIPEKDIEPDCKIEHFNCQAFHQDQDLDYSNMLIVCSGQEGFPEKLQTCDTFKKNKTLAVSPSDRSRNIEALIKYKANGEIYSTDAQLNEELNTVLNLNTKTLRDNRRVIYEEVQKRIIIEGKKKQGNLKKQFLEKEKANFLSLKKGKFKEYCMVGVYLIEKKLSR